MTDAVSRCRRVIVVAVALLAAMQAAGNAHAQAPDAAEVAREVTAAGAVLWDPLDDRPLWSRDAEAPRRMASTTKIMTALLALEAGTIDDVVTVSATADAADAEAGAATLDLRADEQIPMRSLLSGLLMRSGNDAAAAVAEHVAGSQSAFVDLMNDRARQLGLAETHFRDVSGLTDSAEHHASPADLARLAEVAMRRPAFAAMAGRFRAHVPGLGRLTSRNLLLDSYPGATGVKTGYTALAGLCLVASATRDGRTLYTAVLGSDDHFADTAALLNHGFDAFDVVSAADVEPGVYRTAGGAVDLRIVDTTKRTVPVDGTVRVRAWLAPNPPARIDRGTPLGRAELVVDGDIVDTARIEAGAALEGDDQVLPATAVGNAVEDAVRSFVRSSPRRSRVRPGG